MTARRKGSRLLHSRPINPETGEPFENYQAWVKVNVHTRGKTLYVPTMQHIKHVRARYTRPRQAWPWYGAELKVWCAENDVTLTQIAREFGCRPDRVRHWINSDCPLPYGTHLALQTLKIKIAVRGHVRHIERLKRQVRKAKQFDEKRRARRALVRAGGGLENEPDDYL